MTAAVQVTQTRSRGNSDIWQVAVDCGADIQDFRTALASIPTGTVINRIDFADTGCHLRIGMTGPHAPRVQKPSPRPLIPTDELTPTPEELEAARLQIGSASAMGTYAVVGARSAGHAGLIVAAIRSGNTYFAAAELRWLLALDMAARERRDALESTETTRPAPAAGVR
ncbi:hypothetical protein [Frankia sp. KB5]|uniref:hypothetical protein n=1 Tax=Frankia sp. KB5 TaxID=683318 RepID=UPI000A1105AD|nr:hypothetical protein [Frankia sp. KB5]ORT46988.1 hypothetical protein KBI5_22270 [Frankia sp. KB5]